MSGESQKKFHEKISTKSPMKPRAMFRQALFLEQVGSDDFKF